MSRIKNLMIDSGFLKIAVTAEDFIPGEASRIAQLLTEEGFDYVHIRKPHASTREVSDLIEDIPYPLRKRLRLHGHFDLLNQFNLAGAHLNSRCSEAPAAARSLTRSCHSLEETENQDREYKYVFLSPVFDSISKKGYTSQFNPYEIKGKMQAKNVIALGGVTPDKFEMLKDAGFAGAAMLGALWDKPLNF